MPWESVSNHLNNQWNQDGSIAYQMFDLMTRIYSPYQFNPFNLNPLRRVLEDAVDFDALHGCQRTKLIEEDWLKEEHKHKLKHVLIHSIRADGVLCDLSVASKFNTDWHFLLYLRDLGRGIAEQWLEKNFDSIGQRSTVDVRGEFL